MKKELKESQYHHFLVPEILMNKDIINGNQVTEKETKLCAS